MTNEEWLQWRRGGLGSSDAPVVMGVSPWRTPYQLWQEKVYGISDVVETAAMTRGKEKEAEARAWLEKKLNVTLFPQNVQHPDIPWLRASFDCLDLEGHISAEIKWGNKEDHALAKAGKIPEKYVPQVQHQIKVKELPGTLFIHCYGEEKIIVDVPRDNGYIFNMLKDHNKFWDKVVKREPPDLTDRDFVSMESNKEWLKNARELIAIKEQISLLEKKEKETKGTLISLSNDRNALGGGIKFTKSICPGQVDYDVAIAAYLKHLQSLHPGITFPVIDFESFRKNPYTKWTPRATRRE